MSFHKIEGVQVQVKRLSLPVLANIECRECGYSFQVDFDDDYLSYPTTGKPTHRVDECRECGADIRYSVTLNMSLQIDIGVHSD